MAQTFVCWKGGHDLTQGVLAQVTAGGVPVVLGNGEEPVPWRVVVTCPTDQLENVFSSEVTQAQDGNATIVGMQPTPDDTFWGEAAKQISPVNSLTRASDSAKFTIQQISLVALVLGGFGIFTDLGGGFDRHPVLFGAVVAVAAASLLAAVYALYPQVSENVNYDNLLAVKTAYKNAIKHRADWAQFAALLLVVAVCLALYAFFKGNDKTPDAAITTSWDGSGAHGVLNFSVEMKDLPKGTQPTVRLFGLKTLGDKQPTAVSQLVLTRSARGTAKVEEKFVPAKKYRAYRITATMRGAQESVTIKPPPFTPAPTTTKGQSNKSAGADG